MNRQQAELTELVSRYGDLTLNQVIAAHGYESDRQPNGRRHYVRNGRRVTRRALTANQGWQWFRRLDRKLEVLAARRVA